MTVQRMTADDQLAAAIRVRDYLDEEAFRLRRRAETPPERARAIQVEDLRDLAADLVMNLRMERRSDDD